MTADGNSAGRNDEDLVTASAQAGNISRQVAQPVAIETIAVVNQQGRTNLDYQAAKAVENRGRHSLARQPVVPGK